MEKNVKLFFQSCLESSETHFAILEGHFENFHSDPLGVPKGGQKIKKNLNHLNSSSNLKLFDTVEHEIWL